MGEIKLKIRRSKADARDRFTTINKKKSHSTIELFIENTSSSVRHCRGWWKENVLPKSLALTKVKVQGRVIRYFGHYMNEGYSQWQEELLSQRSDVWRYFWHGHRKEAWHFRWCATFDWLASLNSWRLISWPPVVSGADEATTMHFHDFSLNCNQIPSLFIFSYLKIISQAARSPSLTLMLINSKENAIKINKL